MPRVGRKRFSYTPAGRRQARRESIRSGIPVSNDRGYGNSRPPEKRGGMNRLRSAILKRLKGRNKQY